MVSQIKDNVMNDIEIWGRGTTLSPKIYAGTTDPRTYKGQSIMDFKQTQQIKKKEWVEDYYPAYCLCPST